MRQAEVFFFLCSTFLLLLSNSPYGKNLKRRYCNVPVSCSTQATWEHRLAPSFSFRRLREKRRKVNNCLKALVDWNNFVRYNMPNLFLHWLTFSSGCGYFGSVWLRSPNSLNYPTPVSYGYNKSKFNTCFCFHTRLTLLNSLALAVRTPCFAPSSTLAAYALRTPLPQTSLTKFALQTKVHSFGDITKC